MYHFLPVFLIVLCLSACQESLVHTPQPVEPYQVPSIKDGPPDSVHEASLKEVTPAAEPLSRYGNPTDYKIGNQTYEVLTSARGYRARGLASWYGTKFHKKRTSSGEPYDLYTMTAAHRTLPLPTYVKVTNLNNNQTLVVKVNDRGPFHEDRIIDLSYGAALKLGLLPEGTAPVEIEALMTDGLEHQLARYYLQAGAFTSKALAEALQEKIQQISSVPVFIEPYNTYFLVKIGPMANKHHSERLKSELSGRGISEVISILQ